MKQILVILQAPTYTLNPKPQRKPEGPGVLRTLDIHYPTLPTDCSKLVLDTCSTTSCMDLR